MISSLDACAVYGRVAYGWMMTLYPLLGIRRREKIRECLAQWKGRQQRAWKRQ